MFLLVSNLVWGQEDIITSQYIHNQYAINPAFGGSRNCFTIYGAYRKQWLGVKEAPNNELITLHSPLKNDNMALGLKLSNNNISIFQNNQITASYTYRLLISKSSYLAFGLDGGINLGSTNWQKVSTITVNDPLYATNTSSTNLAFGAGVAYYSSKFYTSFSIPSFFYYNPASEGKGEFNPAKVNYLTSAGYLFETNGQLAIQPSALIIFNPDKKVIWDAGATAIYNNLLWVTGAYRSVNEVVIMLAIQPISTVRIGYSYDYAIGKLAQFSGGSHEISIQYDFGYKIKSSNPKFF